MKSSNRINFKTESNSSVKKENDARLVAEGLDFDQLYKKYYQKIFNYFWYRVGHNSAIAEDLAQDTFVRAYDAKLRYQDIGKSYYSYLLTIAHNLLVNYYRKPKSISLDANEIEIPTEIWSELETKDNISSIWRAIQELNSSERNILYLKYREGLRVSQIAEITGKSENAIKLVLSRARKKLKQHPYLESISEFSNKTRTRKIGRYARKR